ncbi:Variant SH3 domain containing protein [Histomonas meleagridis]|uniref:Variant SH3 domain containing protein n=1 Tax=Histomonas meleagridis TaxID=135588 RepID=UPI0035595B5B|nr:Variant SH3 domain containing protein [Histomonas meleagridis]KAH0803470.1 Variant SH3 domain containing protein [Histomonas meleagridis]
MSSAPELVTILRRVKERITKGTGNYSAILKIISARIDAEEKIASLLKSTIPSTYDTTDPLVNNFIEELKKEQEQHIQFSKELKAEVYSPANKYSTTMHEKQKSLLSTVKKTKMGLLKLINDREKAQKEVESAKAKCNGLQGPQLEKQNAKVAKAQQELAKKTQLETKKAQSEASTSIPIIHRDFSDFDSARLSKLQAAIVKFQSLKTSMNGRIDSGAKSFTEKVTTYDTSDRSQQMVTRVFDTSSKDVKIEVQGDGEQTLVGVAISDYRSDEPKDLQFSRGDQIKILSKHKTGWWEGECNGRKGMFPMTFVQLPETVQVKKDPIGAVFLCIKDYMKAQTGDIELHSGDLVYVDFIANGRCSGTNLRDQKRGYFPLDALEQRA